MILQTALSPDGAWEVELSDWIRPSQFDLRSRPPYTTLWRKVGAPLKSDYDVSGFVVSEDSLRVVYREGRTALGDWALYSAPISGGAGVRISQPFVAGSSVEPGFHLLTGGRVRFLYTPDGSPARWYVVPVAGGRILGEVFVDGFNDGTTGGWR